MLRAATLTLGSAVRCGARSQARALHMSPVTAAGQKHRVSLGKSRSGNEYGTLTDLPDWSYTDGTPAPPTQAQLRRERQQKRLLERIAQLQAEMEVAAARPRG
eukprot:m.447240 g.447240  ORF g.447240 m.447240 type:complete len:103 (-) comp19486_c0_seq1:206-514(-)